MHLDSQILSKISTRQLEPKTASVNDEFFDIVQAFEYCILKDDVKDEEKIPEGLTENKELKSLMKDGVLSRHSLQVWNLIKLSASQHNKKSHSLQRSTKNTSLSQIRDDIRQSSQHHVEKFT